MRQRGIRKEPEYKRTQQDAAEKRHLGQQHQDRIGFAASITTVINRVADEYQATRNQTERYESGKRNRENRTLWAISATAAFALLTLIVTHCDTVWSSAWDLSQRCLLW